MIKTGHMSGFELRGTPMNGPAAYNQSDYEFAMDGENDADAASKSKAADDKDNIENNQYA